MASWLHKLENNKKQRSKSSIDERRQSLGKIKLTKINTTRDKNGPDDCDNTDKTSYESDGQEEEDWLEELKV